MHLLTGIQTNKGTSEGLALGVTYMVMFVAYAIAFWYGAKLVVDFKEVNSGVFTTSYTIGTVLTTFFAIIMGAFATAQIGQNSEFFVTAQAAAYSIYELIDRIPEIDIENDSGIKDIPNGQVQFSDVRKLFSDMYLSMSHTLYIYESYCGS